MNLEIFSRKSVLFLILRFYKILSLPIITAIIIIIILIEKNAVVQKRRCHVKNNPSNSILRYPTQFPSTTQHFIPLTSYHSISHCTIQPSNRFLKPSLPISRATRQVRESLIVARARNVRERPRRSLSFAHNSSNDRVGKKKRQPTKIEERKGRKTVPGRGVRFRVVCKTARGKKRFRPVNRDAYVWVVY